MKTGEICEISKNTYFEDILQTIASKILKIIGLEHIPLKSKKL